MMVVPGVFLSELRHGGLRRRKLIFRSLESGACQKLLEPDISDLLLIFFNVCMDIPHDNGDPQSVSYAVPIVPNALTTATT